MMMIWYMKLWTIVKIKYVDELILKNAWDLCCEYDICWWIDIEECMRFVLWMEMW